MPKLSDLRHTCVWDDIARVVAGQIYFTECTGAVVRSVNAHGIVSTIFAFDNSVEQGNHRTGLLFSSCLSLLNNTCLLYLRFMVCCSVMPCNTHTVPQDPRAFAWIC
jgi:hypothetical protein